MFRVISVLIIVCICLIFGMKGISYSESEKYKVSMKEHIEDVKLKHPEKYKAMIEKAKGDITGCESCHDLIGKGKKHSNQALPNFPDK